MKKLLLLAVLLSVLFLGASPVSAGGKINEDGTIDHIGDFN